MHSHRALTITNSPQVCVETMMHLTCTNMPEAQLESALDKVKSYGIQNILALRGDPPKGQESFTVVEGGFSCALDLVKYIRWVDCFTACSACKCSFTCSC